MGGKYIVRIPIKDQDNKIIGYEILYNGDHQAYSQESENEFAAADTIYNFLTQNNAKTLHGTRNFMTFTTTLLMKKTPHLFDKSELVIQIDDSVIIHPLSMHFVKQYAKEGYKIAVNEFEFTPRYLSLLDTIDYIKIDARETPSDTIRNTIEVAHSMGKKCIVTNIDNEETYQMAFSMQADAAEGPAVAERMDTKVNNSAFLQSNFFRLIVAVTKDEPDIDEIEQLISVDAGLTYGLLKMVNSAYFAMRNETTDIHQAVVMLGIDRLKQWVYLLSASNSEEGIDSGTEEFLKKSLLRACFSSELVRYAKGLSISRSDAYLLGMFSTLNHIIDAPLEDILASIPLVDEVKQALLTHEGKCGMLYDLVLSYETADWSAISRCAQELKIPDQVITSTYFNCVEDVNSLWEQLTNTMNTETEETAE